MEIAIIVVIVLVAVWAGMLARRSASARQQPIVYTTTGGAKVTAYPPARPRDRWRWECDGCRTSVVATTAGEDLRPDANRHAETCRALPPQPE